MPALTKIDFPDSDLYILKSGDWQGFRSNACKKEPETVDWIRSFEPESLFWDVGASVGSYTLIAASLGHRVVAFEPFLPSAGELQQNVWTNELSHLVEVHPTALGALYGWGYFHARSTEAGSASHGVGESPFRQAVYMEVADEWLLRRDLAAPDYIKIDVDGFEGDVVGGMRMRSFDNAKSVMIESEPGTIEGIEKILSSQGITLKDSWPRMGETRQKNYLFERQA